MKEIKFISKKTRRFLILILLLIGAFVPFIESVNAVAVGDTFEFSYTGAAQTFEPPVPGKYKLEVWGARGGQGADSNVSNTSWNYGRGGYSYGTIELDKKDSVYVYVGGMGKGTNGETVAWSSVVAGGWNGGGNTYQDGGEFGGSGGGATDIRINSTSLYARAIVAGGGGGSGEDNEQAGTAGGVQSVNAYTGGYIAY